MRSIFVLGRHCHSKKNLPFQIICSLLFSSRHFSILASSTSTSNTRNALLSPTQQQQQQQQQQQPESQCKRHFTQLKESKSIHKNIHNDKSSSTTTTTTMERMLNHPDQEIGGGAINEKKRTYGRIDPTDASTTTTVVPSGFQPTHYRSHLMHAIEGLDRYPNYLSRWDTTDVEELEQALEQRLEQVRQQKQRTIEVREKLTSIVQGVCQQQPKFQTLLLEPPTTWEQVRSNILDPRASRAIFRSAYFATMTTNNNNTVSVAQVLNGTAQVELDAGYLEELMDEEVYDVYTFPLLSKSFCALLQDYIRHIAQEVEAQCSSTTNNNDMNNDSDEVTANVMARALRNNLDFLGLSWLNDLLFHLVLRPISRHLYLETELQSRESAASTSTTRNGTAKADLDWRHGFIVAYSLQPNRQLPRQRLVPHTDDSEVTLNVCIGDDTFEGGKLQFWGLRGTRQAGTLASDEAYTPQIGRALIHAGRQLHEVTDVTSGDRFALIMWSRSWSGIRSTTCPCCWLQRRTAGGNDPTSSSSRAKATSAICICDKKWN